MRPPYGTGFLNFLGKALDYDYVAGTVKAWGVSNTANALGGLAKGAGRLLFGVGIGLSGVVAASDQWGQDADRDDLSRVFRAGVKGITTGAGTALGGLGGGALCSKLGPVAIGCAVGGGILGGQFGGWVGDRVLDAADDTSQLVNGVLDAGTTLFSDVTHSLFGGLW